MSKSSTKLGSRDVGDEIWVNDFTEESAQKFRESLLEEAKGDLLRPIVIYIDSYGGQVDSLAKMIETMDELPNPIVTVAVGKAMSCGSILLSHGDVRFCGNHARIMIHEVSGGAVGDVHDVSADVEEMKRLNRYFMGILAKNCGIKGGYDVLRKMIKGQDGRDNYMDAVEALKFGIVDAIGMPKINRMKLYQVEATPRKVRTGSKTSTKKPDSKRSHK
jgi:ATP-dependent Clp endopeptidase proteolytic subunit ClpP